MRVALTFVHSNVTLFANAYLMKRISAALRQLGRASGFDKAVAEPSTSQASSSSILCWNLSELWPPSNGRDAS